MNQKLLANIAVLIDKDNILREIKNPVNYFEETKES
jgi:hypothetical protein